MLNEKQLDLSEKILVNSANVVLGVLVFGGILGPRFNLFVFGCGCILFSIITAFAFWVRRGDKK